MQTKKKKYELTAKNTITRTTTQKKTTTYVEIVMIEKTFNAVNKKFQMLKTEQIAVTTTFETIKQVVVTKELKTVKQIVVTTKLKIIKRIKITTELETLKKTVEQMITLNINLFS